MRKSRQWSRRGFFHTGDRKASIFFLFHAQTLNLFRKITLFDSTQKGFTKRHLLLIKTAFDVCLS